MHIDPAAEERRRSSRREWNKQRLANIHMHVTAADVLMKNGIELQRGGTQSEQISCPFHGDDRRPSAKYFPPERDKPSAVWCFVCHERWDALTLWKKFSGTEKFTEILREIERAFALTRPEPHQLPDAEEPADPLVDEVQQLFKVAERRLREYRHCFAMESHLKLGQIIDYTLYHLERKQITLATAKERLEAVHARLKKSRVPRATTPSDT